MANKIVFGSEEYELFKERTAAQKKGLNTPPLTSASLSPAAGSPSTSSSSSIVPSGSTSSPGSVSSQSTTINMANSCYNARKSLKRKAEADPDNGATTSTNTTTAAAASTNKPKRLKCKDSSAFFACSRTIKRPNQGIEYLNPVSNGFKVVNIRKEAPTIQDQKWTDVVKDRAFSYSIRVVQPRPKVLFKASESAKVLRPAFLGEDVILKGDEFDKNQGRMPLHERGHCTGQLKVAQKLPGLSMVEAVEASKKRRAAAE